MLLGDDKFREGRYGRGSVGLEEVGRLDDERRVRMYLRDFGLMASRGYAGSTGYRQGAEQFSLATCNDSCLQGGGGGVTFSWH